MPFDGKIIFIKGCEFKNIIVITSILWNHILIYIIRCMPVFILLLFII